MAVASIPSGELNKEVVDLVSAGALYNIRREVPVQGSGYWAGALRRWEGPEDPDPHTMKSYGRRISVTGHHLPACAPPFAGSKTLRSRATVSKETDHMKDKKRPKLPRGLRWHSESQFIWFTWYDAQGRQHKKSTETTEPTNALHFKLRFLEEQGTRKADQVESLT
jgi:hypothetical protein